MSVQADEGLKKISTQKVGERKYSPNQRILEVMVPQVSVSK